MSSSPINPPIVELGPWLDTPAGRYLAAWEMSQYDNAVGDVFGYHALQIGLPEMDCLRANRMPFKGFVGETPAPANLHFRWSAVAVADSEELPFESQSVDLVVLPHALEMSPDPHQVLREAERVLIPEGRLVITGFNPWSLWGLRQKVQGHPSFLPDHEQILPLTRLKDWLTLLSFELDRGRFGCYRPLCKTNKWLDRYAFMEKAGDRWWPVCGAAYAVSAVKRVSGMRLIAPAWKQRKSARRAGMVATPKLGDVQAVQPNLHNMHVKDSE
ncbi:class I SAM-dependent methyltransferase [Pigmentiphaga aceris]|uniref:Class I SAM-dependent methyltransferase n=1 Tax=Pigmentiphaga aceris TaxID=1940612 RepID=A0A5C0AUG6_9BURK|nr:class I SAM-dependent methyltransferase [Pigmentiphaga aceris]QEI05314.1 class I SAM-dependent methyltransferase [Pigmentiphaga aceris]